MKRDRFPDAPRPIPRPRPLYLFPCEDGSGQFAVAEETGNPTQAPRVIYGPASQERCATYVALVLGSYLRLGSAG